MSEDETPPEPTPENPDRGKALYLLISLVPLPVGLLMGPTRIFDGLQKRDFGMIELGLFLGLICCIVGWIGIFEGFKTGAWQKWIAGVAVGFIFWSFLTFVLAFVGCCQGLGHVAP